MIIDIKNIHIKILKERNIYIYINRDNDHISKSGCIVLNFRRLLHYYPLVL
jgi:hypothetical protein